MSNANNFPSFRDFQDYVEADRYREAEIQPKIDEGDFFTVAAMTKAWYELQDPEIPSSFEHYRASDIDVTRAFNPQVARSFQREHLLHRGYGARAVDYDEENLLNGNFYPQNDSLRDAAEVLFYYGSEYKPCAGGYSYLTTDGDFHYVRPRPEIRGRVQKECDKLEARFREAGYTAPYGWQDESNCNLLRAHNYGYDNALMAPDPLWNVIPALPGIAHQTLQAVKNRRFPAWDEF